MIRRRYPVGAEVLPQGVHFRVWAPACEHVDLIIEPAGNSHALQREPDGYHSMLATDLGPGARYRFRLDRGRAFPDPASRFQPDGPHGASEVIDASAYRWSARQWCDITQGPQIFYEMHIGTFTKPGTWLAALEHLPDLADMGITALEIMPIADFPGRFGWGYDGVDLYAPANIYGRPDDFRRFIDRAHALGLAVILDVVYNHIGPDGNYLKEFSPAYFTQRYGNEWGEAINFDGEDAQPVREFFTANAAYWIDEYRLDGLRLDATQQIFDASARNILHDVGAAVRAAAAGRPSYVVAENEVQDTALLLHHELDAMWNDDFHHSAMVALTGRREAYYSDHHGSPQEFIAVAKYNFLFQGQRYEWQGQTRGTPAIGIPANRFVHFLENHDQVANSTTGGRLIDLAAPGQLRAMTALLLLGPQTPLLFQGQEFGSSKPFFFFADHHAGLVQAVAEGRVAFLRQFASIAANPAAVPAPHDPGTFERCKLDHAEALTKGHIRALHRDLISLRKRDDVFARAGELGVDGAVIAPNAFVLRYFGGAAGDRLLFVNLGTDFTAGSIADPLIAPPVAASWTQLWSSDELAYGGPGALRIAHDSGWHVRGHSAVVLASRTE